MFEILLDPQHLPFWILVLGILAGAIAIISRPFSTYVRFVYPNAKFESIGNPFLNEKNLDPHHFGPFPGSLQRRDPNSDANRVSTRQPGNR